MSVEWRCFHCEEVFTDRASAARHFGTDWFCEQEAPACIQFLTEGEKAIVEDMREAGRLMRSAETALEQAEGELDAMRWSIKARWPKLTTIGDVWHEYEFLEGRALAAEAALAVAPAWLASLLRRLAERRAAKRPRA